MCYIASASARGRELSGRVRADAYNFAVLCISLCSRITGVINLVVWGTFDYFCILLKNIYILRLLCSGPAPCV